MSTFQTFTDAVDLLCVPILIWVLATPLRRRLGWTTFYEQMEAKSRQAWQGMAVQLQQRALTEIELIDRILLVTDDLIRIEPERAESLEVAKLELLKHRDQLGQDLDLFGTVGQSLLKVVPELVRQYRSRRDT